MGLSAQTSPSGPHAAALGSDRGSGAQAEAQTAGTLAELDDRLAMASAAVLVVRAPAELREALLAHAARRAKGAGRGVILARAGDGAPLWQDAASRLSIAKLVCEPAGAASQLATSAFLRRTAIVAALPRAGSWDRTVTAELSLLPNAPLVVLVSDGEDDASDVRGERFDVGPTLDEDARARWWRALAEEASDVVGSCDLAAYEAWWSAVKRAPVARESLLEVPAEGRALFRSLALAAAPWRESAVEALAEGAGDSGALPALARVGAVVTSSGWVAIAPSWASQTEAFIATASADERARVAAALTGEPDPQPWAFARAAVLLAHGAADGPSIEAADGAHARALAGTEDATARREIVARWMDAIDALPPEPRRELLMRAAERALAASEPDEAMRCAQAAAGTSAAGTSTENARALLLMGRAAAAVGDLVAGRVALDRARRLAEGAGDTELEARAAAEQAEISYRAGDIAMARELALGAIARSTEPGTRLTGRNTLGKLLLLELKWDEADGHFAEDGLSAVAAHDAVAELRARLNRGIALLSKGQLDEARAIFEAVLSEGERRNEPRAKAYALMNLGVIAVRRHEYGAALMHWERTIKLRHAMRERISVAHTLANLAELRHTLGLLDYAEHAVTFGRRTLGGAMTSLRAANFAVVAARIALSRGRSTDARREIDTGIACAESSKDRDVLGQAHRMAARVALEDGDLARVRASLDRARELSTKSDSIAEVALLEALLDRASGKDAMPTARNALGLARVAAKEELLREAHVLLGELCHATGDRSAAGEHLAQAALVRDKVAEGLPADVRDAFLARPEVELISRLQSQLSAPSSAPSALAEEDGVSSSRLIRDGRGAAREIIGDDPAIRGLLAAIRKVARASSTVLIRGESGTGKELVAEALHRASDRAAGPLVTVNCAALVETLLLSELFGHEKGAFTGASARRRGRFELAEGGTLFLDEIGDISPRTQVALLRVLQERTFERVGGTTRIHADVRIVCATHRDLRAMVERGEFREDLYYRLRGITLEVPALRARLGDLPRIAGHLLARIATERCEPAKSLGADALELLGRHKWPGNVRELENALRAASLFAESSVITARDLTDNLDDLRALAARTGASASSSPALTLAVDGDVPSEDEVSDSDGPLPQIEANATSVAYAQVRLGTVSLSDLKRQIERDCIARALAETKGNITRAAALLGMKRPRLSQLVKQYGLAAVSSEA